MIRSRVEAIRGCWRPRLRRAAIGLLVVAALLASVGLAIALYGPVYGEEFCPETFQRRAFWLWELPLWGIPLTAERRRDATQEGEQMLRAEGWLQPQAPAEPQWHLVWQVRGRVRQSGEAELLLRYLDSRDPDRELRWLRWSVQHPQLAQILWPSVQQLARQGQYVQIPDLFLLALTHRDPAALAAAIQQRLKERSAEGSGPP